MNDIKKQVQEIVIDLQKKVCHCKKSEPNILTRIDKYEHLEYTINYLTCINIISHEHFPIEV